MSLVTVRDIWSIILNDYFHVPVSYTTYQHVITTCSDGHILINVLLQPNPWTRYIFAIHLNVLEITYLKRMNVEDDFTQIGLVKHLTLPSHFMTYVPHHELWKLRTRFVPFSVPYLSEVIIDIIQTMPVTIARG